MRTFIFALAFLLSPVGKSQPTGWPLSPEQRLSSLSVEEKIGQLLFFGFPGSTFEPRLAGLIERYQPGGLIVFSHNIESAWQIAQLNHQVQSRSRTPVLLAVDQEGGDVARIKTSPPLPSAGALGNTQSAELAHLAGQEAGRLLKSMGFNMNFAPVVDVAKPGSFLGTRAFGQEPEKVAELTLAYSRGLIEAGILPTLKHFPGHGGAAEDSHAGQPVVHSDKLELLRGDLFPFRHILSQLKLAPAVMVAHVSYPQLDPSGRPATYSPAILRGLLRRNLKFEGLSVTDDLEMSGAHLDLDVGERAVQAFLAGNDLLMVVWTPAVKQKVFQSLLEAARRGRISAKRLDESVLRILKTKRKLGLFEPPAQPQQELIKAQLSSPRLKSLSESVVISSLKRSLSPEVLSKFQNAGPLLVVSAQPSFYSGVKKLSGSRTVLHRTYASTSAEDLNRWLLAHPEGWALVHVAGKNSGRWLSQVSPKVHDRIVVINTAARTNFPKGLQAVVEINSSQPELGALLGRLLFAPLRTPSAEL